MKHSNFDHILVVTQWNRNEYAGFEARELWQSESGQSWNYRKYNDNARAYVPPTEGIKLSCQCNLRDDNRKMYALECKIDGDMNMQSLEQSRSNISRLTKIEKKYTELCKKFGYPESFSKFAAYIAEIIGADLAETSQYNFNEYSYMDISTLEYKERKVLDPS
jgi:hypothetical protein